MQEFHIPQLTEFEQNKFNNLLSLFFYDTATSFSTVENDVLNEALQVLRPDVKIPSRKQLEGELLDETFQNVKLKINDIVKKKNYHATLITNFCTNVSRVPILTYCSSSPTESIFLESVATNGQSHSESFLLDDMKRILNLYPYLAGVCTDNTAANQKAWEILKQNDPHLFCYGCQSHALHLLIHDLFESTNEEHPFSEIHLQIQSCLEVSKFFQKSPLQLSKYKESNPNAIAFQVPCPTRWGTIGSCLESIENQYLSIIRFVNDPIWFNEGTQKQITRKAN